jgi:hypothetical protein
MALQITPTERHALQLLANGYTSNDVATDLGIGTVETEVLLKRLFATSFSSSRVFPCRPACFVHVTFSRGVSSYRDESALLQSSTA